MTTPQVTDRQFVVRFLGIFLAFGVAISVGILLGGTQHEKDQLLMIIGPPIALVFFLWSLVPYSLWLGLLAAFAVWVFFSILGHVVRAAVHEALQERERR